MWTRTLQAELSAIGKRLPELDKLIQSASEDKVLGRIPESVCVNLLNQYEAERREKQERRKELTEQLAASRETESSVDAWLDMMQDYAQLEELDRPTLVRLIQKIEISERYTVDDHEAGVLQRCCEFQNLFQVLQEQGPHSESGGKLGYVQECPRNPGTGKNRTQRIEICNRFVMWRFRLRRGIRITKRIPAKESPSNTSQS